MTHRRPYAFPLHLQTLLPEDYHAAGFRQMLRLLRGWGFSGLELNIVRPEPVDPDALRAFLAEYGLRLTMFASGATAKAEGLSLSSADEAVRQRSVARARDFIDFAAQLDAGVIVGFLKGRPDADPAAARLRLRDSLRQIEPHVRARSVPLLLEATHRNESAAAHTLADTAELIAGFDNPFLRILPDMYHMALEEKSITGALLAQRGLYDVVHISDDNRLYPGLGTLDFVAILEALAKTGYKGAVTIEGNLRGSFEEDLKASMQVLGPALRRAQAVGQAVSLS